MLTLTLRVVTGLKLGHTQKLYNNQQKDEQNTQIMLFELPLKEYLLFHLHLNIQISFKMHQVQR